MSNVRVVPVPDHPDPGRSEVGGAICPTCRLAADLSTPDKPVDHVCITLGGDLGPLMVAAPHEAWQPLLEQLARHPARPFDNTTGTLRAVGRTWCFCGKCATRGESR